MKQALTQNQIAALFTFCEKHHVRQYDVQLELVDHLANAIEEKLTINPALAFDEALLEVHAGFGVKGFAGIVNAKQRSMEKFCFKKRWELYRSYFTWPKAAMTICLLTGLILAKGFITVDEQQMIFAVAGISLMTFELAIIGWSVYLFKKQKKKLMITETGINTGHIASICAFNFLVGNSGQLSDFGYYFSSVLSILFFVYVLAYWDFLIKLNQLARKEYPQVFEVAA